MILKFPRKEYMKSHDETYDSDLSRNSSLKRIVEIMQHYGAGSIYVKKLAPNDNSKNQPYFGGHLTDLPFIPTGEMVASESQSKKPNKRKIKFTTSLNFAWLDANGNKYPAPNAKLIYYPQYPEVRFSGFLKGSKVKLSRWMCPTKQGLSEGRWLILGVSADNTVYGFLVTPESNLASELENTNLIEISQVFKKLEIRNRLSNRSTRDLLFDKLLEIHQMGWVPGQKLGKDSIPSPYKATNGGGYTLESLLGIKPNGIAEPDYLGWEVKQFGVKRFPKISANPTTLFTPEPNGGFYVNAGVIDFIKTYGYPDKNGKPDRLNFGGTHLVNECHKSTQLTMILNGFDVESKSITRSSGAVELVDEAGNVTASWSFAKLMDHWKKKHAKAVYIPCVRRTESRTYEYHYGKNIELGIGTTFEYMLSAMNKGTVYYDPGIKVENISSEKPKSKRRSQFRIKHKHLDTLYKNYEFIDIKSGS